MKASYRACVYHNYLNYNQNVFAINKTLIFGVASGFNCILNLSWYKQFNCSNRGPHLKPKKPESNLNNPE